MNVWDALLGNILRNGTTAPAQLQPDKSEQQTQIFIYLLAIVLVIGTVYVFTRKS